MDEFIEKTADYFENKISDATVAFCKSNKGSKNIKIYHSKVKEVVDEIKEIPKGKRTYGLNMTLVNGSLIIKDITTALVTLIDNKEDGQDDPMWSYHMGLCFFNEGKLKREAALPYFKKFMEYTETNYFDEDMIRNMRFMINMIDDKKYFL